MAKGNHCVADADHEAIRRYLRKRDRRLGRVIDAVGPYRLRRTPNRFEALAASIISQQISIRAAAAIHDKLRSRLRPKRLTATEVQRMSVDELRQAGLSRSKAAFLHGPAEAVVSGRLRLASVHRYDDQAVIDRLTEIRGIGRWTAEMFLIFCLGRLDVLPVDDFGLRLAIQYCDNLPELPSQAAVRQRGAVWQPYRTVATWYLWQWLRLVRDGDAR